MLVDAPALSNVGADREAFKSHFSSCKDEKLVVDFLNLAGDTRLLAPCPHPDISDTNIYSSIASFMRNAPENQIKDFWKTSANLYLERIQVSSYLI